VPERFVTSLRARPAYDRGMGNAALLFTLVAATGCADSLPGASDEPARSLAAAESAFAAHSVREDMRAAFLANFAPDAVYVRRGWVEAVPNLQSHPAPPIVLDWRPVHVEAAASGDFGLSTGPWKITSKSKPDAPPAFGQFVSIWRRSPDGAWRVEVDLGIDHPQSALWDAPLEARALSGAGTPAADGIATAEARFARDARTDGARSAYRAYGADNLRYYRNGNAPVVGRAASLASAAMSDDCLVYTIERSETARSNDLGYARGSFAAASAPTVPLGYFMRVWRLEAGEWRLALDVANPAS
jgi:ketosteroid isomerase-like protein